SQTFEYLYVGDALAASLTEVEFRDALLRRNVLHRRIFTGWLVGSDCFGWKRDFLECRRRVFIKWSAFGAVDFATLHAHRFASGITIIGDFEATVVAVHNFHECCPRSLWRR